MTDPIKIELDEFCKKHNLKVALLFYYKNFTDKQVGVGAALSDTHSDDPATAYFKGVFHSRATDFVADIARQQTNGEIFLIE